MSVKLVTAKSRDEAYVDLCETQFAGWKLPIYPTGNFHIVVIGASLFADTFGNGLPSLQNNLYYSSYASAVSSRTVVVWSWSIGGTKYTTTGNNSFAYRLEQAQTLFTDDDTLFIVHAGGDIVDYLPITPTKDLSTVISRITQTGGVNEVKRNNRTIILHPTFRSYTSDSDYDDNTIFDDEYQGALGFFRRIRSNYSNILAGSVYDWMRNRHTGVLADGVHIRGRSTANAKMPIEFGERVIDVALRYAGLSSTVRPMETTRRQPETDRAAIHVSGSIGTTTTVETYGTYFMNIGSAVALSTSYPLKSATGHALGEITFSVNSPAGNWGSSDTSNQLRFGRSSNGVQARLPSGQWDTYNANAMACSAFHRTFIYFGYQVLFDIYISCAEGSYDVSIACSHPTATHNTVFTEMVGQSTPGNSVTINMATELTKTLSGVVSANGDGIMIRAQVEQMGNVALAGYFNGIQIRRVG